MEEDVLQWSMDWLRQLSFQDPGQAQVRAAIVRANLEPIFGEWWMAEAESAGWQLHDVWLLPRVVQAVVRLRAWAQFLFDLVMPEFIISS